MNSEVSSHEMDKIYTNDKGHSLWLGNVRAALNLNSLKNNKIKIVITVANNVKVRFDENIQHHVHSIRDHKDVDIIGIIIKTNTEIEEGLSIGSVLVHCLAGISRSASVVLAYLMNSQNWTYSYTFNYLREKRPIINPNPGFKRQLDAYGQEVQQRYQHSKTTSETLMKLRRQLIQIDVQSQLKLLLKSPKRVIELNKNSTDEEKQIYRQQMAQKLFEKTYSINSNKQTKRDISTHSASCKTLIKAPLSIYRRIDENGYGFISERK